MPLTKTQRNRLFKQQVCQMYYTQSMTAADIAAHYGQTVSQIEYILHRMRRQWALTAEESVNHAKAIQVEQTIEVSRRCIRLYDQTQDPAHIVTMVRAYDALRGPVTSATNPSQITNVSVSSSSQAEAKTIIEIKEVEDWYGEHSARAHATEANHADIAKAVAAHQRRIAEAGTIQGDLVRPTLGEDGNQHADDFEGPRTDSGLLAGGLVEAERELPVDGDDPQASEAVYMGFDFEGDPIYLREEE